MTPCRVCQLIDHDETLKPTAWCELCQADLCDPCRGHLGRRLLAATIERLGGLRHADAAR